MIRSHINDNDDQLFDAKQSEQESANIDNTAGEIQQQYSSDAEFGALVKHAELERKTQGTAPGVQMPEWVENKSAEAALSTRKSGRRVNDLKRFPAVAGISIAALLFLYIPMLIVVAFSFNGGHQALLWKGFSFTWYASVFTDDAIIRATGTSLEVAAIATAVSCIIGVLYVLALDNMSRAGSAIATGLINASLLIPEIVLGVSTMAFIRLIGMTPGFLPLILAHSTFCIPFAVMPIRARLQSLDRSCFEAAADLGASGWQTVRSITLPQLMPGIVSGALMAFVVSMDDFMISNFLTSAGTTTLPIYIFSLIRKGVNPSINVVATLLLLLAMAVTAVSTALTSRRSS